MYGEVILQGTVFVEGWKKVFFFILGIESLFNFISFIVSFVFLSYRLVYKVGVLVLVNFRNVDISYSGDEFFFINLYCIKSIILFL